MDGQAVDSRAADGRAAIAGNVEALKRILVSLVAMAAPGDSTLPRHLHRAILRLLRPAEAAARRLIIALAMTRQAREKATVATDAPGRGVAPNPQARPARAFQPTMPVQPVRPAVRPPLRRLSLPLADPLARPFRPAPARSSGVPRLWAEAMTAPRPAIPQRRAPGPNDRLDSTRLRLRLDALASALGDMPRQAARFARWQARQAMRRERGSGRWPLRPGRPPGSARPRGRRLVHGVSSHEVQAVLAHAHELGWWALEQRRDTS